MLHNVPASAHQAIGRAGERPDRECQEEEPSGNDRSLPIGEAERARAEQRSIELCIHFSFMQAEKHGFIFLRRQSFDLRKLRFKPEG